MTYKTHFERTGSRLIKTRYLKNFNKENFLRDLEQKPWCEVISTINDPKGGFPLSEIFRPNRNFSLFHELSSRTNCKKTKRNFVSVEKFRLVESGLNDMWATWKSLLMTCIDKHAPLRSKRVRQEKITVDN